MLIQDAAKCKLSNKPILPTFINPHLKYTRHHFRVVSLIFRIKALNVGESEFYIDTTTYCSLTVITFIVLKSIFDDFPETGMKQTGNEL